MCGERNKMLNFPNNEVILTSKRRISPNIKGSLAEKAITVLLLAAIDDGIVNRIDPGPAEERNIYEAMSAGKEVKKIPMTFGDALDELDADEVIKSSMPGDMYRVFKHYKRDEWERYCATVSDWDVKEYLDVLP